MLSHHAGGHKGISHGRGRDCRWKQVWFPGAENSQLGSVLSRQGKYEEAEAMHRRALEGLEKVLGRQHPHTLISVDNLGSLLGRQGKYKEAEGLKLVFLYQASVGSGTYIDHNSRVSQDDTLITQDGPAILVEKVNSEMPDSNSTSSRTTTGREKLGKDYIARFLAQDAEMRVLCSSVLDRVDREQVVDFALICSKTFISAYHNMRRQN